MNNNTTMEFSNTDTKLETSAIIVLIIVTIGTIGNLLALIAFRSAKQRKRHGFHKSWMSNYVFIWNLAAIDLLGSLNMTIIYIQFVFDPLAINHPFLCIVQITIRDILLLAEGCGIVSIAVVRMLGITKSIAWLNFCDKNSNVIILLLIPWCFGALLYVRKILLINDALLDESKDSLDCGIFFYKLNSSEFTLYFEFCAHVAAFIIIFACSIRIILYVRATSKSIGSKTIVSKKESNTTKIIFGVCIVHMIQCIPYMLVRGIFVDSMRNGFFIQFSIPFRICYILYYTQFAFNIFIYTIGKMEFRNAYKDLFIKVFRCCCKLAPDPEIYNHNTSSPKTNVIQRVNKNNANNPKAIEV